MLSRDKCRRGWKQSKATDQEHSAPSATDSSHLYEGDVSRKLLLDVLEVLQWLSEG